MKLTKLSLGKKAYISKLNATERKKRRLLDLGLIPGTLILAKRRSPLGDPTAFLIRGTILALRSEETDLIEIEILKQNSFYKNNKEVTNEINKEIE